MDLTIEDWFASLDSDLNLMASLIDDDDVITHLPSPVDFTPPPQLLYFYTDNDHEVTMKMFSSVATKFMPLQRQCVELINNNEKITLREKDDILNRFLEFNMFFICYQAWFNNTLSKIESRYTFQFIYIYIFDFVNTYHIIIVCKVLITGYLTNSAWKNKR